MCGICGLSGVSEQAWAEEAVVALNVQQHHRGPDSTGLATFGRHCIGNTRLAIVDLSPAGEQPILSRSGRIAVVFNGEIYNHRELIGEHRLPVDGGSDGAVIPELYERYGPESLRMLRGMYAVAIVDTAADTLLLARDPLGIKPLYWRRLPDGQLAFASEPRTLLDVGPPACVDRQAVARYLAFGSVGDGNTPFVDVQGLAANTWVTLGGTGIIAQGTIEPLPLAPQQPEPGLRAALLDSVRLHLRSDVPFALLLSSGVDSTAIAWAAHQLGTSLTCLTVDLGGGRDEVTAARRTAQRYGHQHETVQRPLADDDVRAFFQAMQQPTVDGLNTFLVSHAVHGRGLKVALSGLGGDEATGGYSHYRLLRLLPLLKELDRLPPALRGKPLGWVARRGRSPKLTDLLGPHGPRDAFGLDLLQRRVWPLEEVSAATGVGPDTWLPQPPEWLTGGRRPSDLSYAEAQLYLGGILLPDADTFSMAHSVELRVPFVDVEFLRVSLHHNGKRLLGKRRFASAIADPWLTQIARAPKQGFALPMDEWMRGGPLRPYVDELASRAAPVWDHVDRTIGGMVVERWRNGGRWAEAWALAALNGWLQTLPPKG